MSDFTGHTPGPWRFDIERGVVSDTQKNMAGVPYTVASAVDYEDGLLIAAAPDLLVENKRLREALDTILMLDPAAEDAAFLAVTVAGEALREDGDGE